MTSFSAIIILGMVARNYGEAGTGIFTLTLTYLAIFYLLSDFGFNAHVLRKFPICFSNCLRQNNFQFSIEWRKLLGIRMIWSGILVILALVLLPFWPFTTPEFAKAVFFGSLTIAASAIFITCNLAFQSQLRYDLSILALSLGTVVNLAILIILATAKSPVPFLLFAYLIGWIGIALAALVLVRKLLKNVSPLFNLNYAKNLFKESWPIAATLALNVVYFRADAFMIAYFKPMTDVGVYNIAYSIFQSVLVLPTFIMNAYYPLMLRSLSGIKLVGLGLLGLASLGTLAVIMLAPLILRILTGGGFAGSVESLQILSLGFPAYFLSALLMWLLVTKGRYKTMLSIYALGLVLNLSLNLVYIPQYSYIGASWTTVASEYVILGVQVVVLWLKPERDPSSLCSSG